MCRISLFRSSQYLPQRNQTAEHIWPPSLPALIESAPSSCQFRGENPILSAKSRQHVCLTHAGVAVIVHCSHPSLSPPSSIPRTHETSTKPSGDGSFPIRDTPASLHTSPSPPQRYHFEADICHTPESVAIPYPPPSCSPFFRPSLVRTFAAVALALADATAICGALSPSPSCPLRPALPLLSLSPRHRPSLPLPPAGLQQRNIRNVISKERGASERSESEGSVRLNEPNGLNC